MLALVGRRFKILIIRHVNLIAEFSHRFKIQMVHFTALRVESRHDQVNRPCGRATCWNINWYSFQGVPCRMNCSPEWRDSFRVNFIQDLYFVLVFSSFPLNIRCPRYFSTFNLRSGFICRQRKRTLAVWMTLIDIFIMDISNMYISNRYLYYGYLQLGHF